MAKLKPWALWFAATCACFFIYDYMICPTLGLDPRKGLGHTLQLFYVIPLIATFPLNRQSQRR